MLKRLIVAVFVLGLLFGSSACGSADEPRESHTSGSEVGSTDTTPSYTVTIVDEYNHPVSGVLLQLCLETCIPNTTDTNGRAEFFSLPDGNYKVSLLSIPDGYDYATEEREWYFSDGENAIIIALDSVA